MKRTLTGRLALLVAALALVPACGRANRAAAPPETPPASPPAPPPMPAIAIVSWSQDVWPILIVRCSVCHTTGPGSVQVPDMRMTDSASLYQEWVRIFSTCNPNLFRVFPGNSGLSFVWDKVSHPAPMCGQRMPPSGPPLNEEELRLIRLWIDQGALHN
jgi:hypothetical protein